MNYSFEGGRNQPGQNPWVPLRAHQIISALKQSAYSNSVQFSSGAILSSVFFAGCGLNMRVGKTEGKLQWWIHDFSAGE
jgi:hypothetical protein